MRYRSASLLAGGLVVIGIACWSLLPRSTTPPPAAATTEIYPAPLASPASNQQVVVPESALWPTLIVRPGETVQFFPSRDIGPGTWTADLGEITPDGWYTAPDGEGIEDGDIALVKWLPADPAGKVLEVTITPDRMPDGKPTPGLYHRTWSLEYQPEHKAYNVLESTEYESVQTLIRPVSDAPMGGRRGPILAPDVPIEPIGISEQSGAPTQSP